MRCLASPLPLGRAGLSLRCRSRARPPGPAGSWTPLAGSTFPPHPERLLHSTPRPAPAPRARPVRQDRRSGPGFSYNPPDGPAVFLPRPSIGTGFIGAIWWRRSLRLPSEPLRLSGPSRQAPSEHPHSLFHEGLEPRPAAVGGEVDSDPLERTQECHASSGALPRTPGFVRHGVASTMAFRRGGSGCFHRLRAHPTKPSNLQQEPSCRWTWPLIVSGQATGPIASATAWLILGGSLPSVAHLRFTRRVGSSTTHESPSTRRDWGLPCRPGLPETLFTPFVTSPSGWAKPLSLISQSFLE